MLLNAVAVFAILCAGPVLFFSLGRKFFGLTKEQARDHIKRSVRNILFIFGIALILPSLFFLVTNYLDNVVHGPMTTGDFLKRSGEFSFQATFDLYAYLFSRFSKI